MSSQRNVVVMGGHSKGYHEFAEMAPVYQRFLSQAGLLVRLTEDRDDFRKERLAEVDVVVDYTTGGALSEPQAAGLLDFVKSGRGFVGVHSAADSYHNCRAYERMVGGIFLTHPPIIPHTFKTVEAGHPCLAGLPAEFTMPRNST